MASLLRASRAVRLLVIFAAPTFVACGNSSAGLASPPTTPDQDGAVPPGTDPPPTDDTPDATAGDSAASDGAASDGASSGWTTLISGDWTLPAGTEGYTCIRKTVDEEMFASAFDAINPPGTHHTLLTMGAANAADGSKACSASETRPLDVFSSGVGTDPLEFPPGVAVRIPKDTQLLLNLHLFNTRADAISGNSGTRARLVPASAVVHEAEGILAGTIRLDLPAGQTTRTVGHCTMSHDVTIFAVAPHMHQLGTYEKVVAETAAKGEVVLHDAPYDFNEQSFKLVEPLQLAKGDKLRVECTHQNTTSQRVTFGESTLAEMCFAGIFRFPANGSSLICADPS